MTVLAQSQAPKLRPWKLVLGGIVIAMLAVLAWGLTRDPSYIPSQLVGRDMPAFALPALDGNGTVAADDLRGTPLVINFWASWCVSCRAEHALLTSFGREAATRDDVHIVGINYRDAPAAAARFQDDLGSFAYRSGQDPSGRTGIDFGVYGLPETFFVGRDGVVMARHVGPLTEAALKRNLELIGVTR
jgi:cytochrome c biogenesis protein CcmG/thiol:disulfide interchange protein DsbE